MDVEKSLIKARIQLLLDRCFYGNLALHLKLVEDNSIPTFATDGMVILYNKEFAKSLDNKKQQWVICHEILHNALYHLSRRGQRDIKKWNVAIDFAVNAILYKEFGFVLDGCLYSRRFENMSAEKIYNLLPDEDSGKGDDGSGKGKSGENGNPSDDIQSIEYDKDGKVSKINGKKVTSIDSHKDITKGKTKSEVEEIEKEWKIQTTKSYQQSKMCGKEPSGMDIFIKELLEPKVNWKTQLKQFVVSCARTEYNWLKPDRRFIHRGLYMPSRCGNSLKDVVVIVDVSGSTLRYLPRFFSECNAILQEYEMNLHLIVVDTKVKHYEVFTKDDMIVSKFRGGGGTDVRVAFDKIREENILPSVVVCITDGETPFPEGAEYPTLWVVPDTELESDKFPFGQVVRIEDDKNAYDN